MPTTAGYITQFPHNYITDKMMLMEQKSAD